MNSYVSTHTPTSPGTELIKLMSSGSTTLVPAKDLYDFLEVNSNFTTWAKRMFEYGFEEQKDFIPILEESTGGRPSQNYALTFDCAKHIAMVQRSEKGMQARQFFIDAEKELNKIQPNTFKLPKTYQDALRELADKEDQRLLLEQKNKQLLEVNDKLHSDNVLKSIKIQRDADKVDFADTVSSNRNTYLFREAIKAVNSTIKEADLRNLMIQDGIIYTKLVMGQKEYHSYSSHKEKFFEKTNPLPNGLNKTTLKFRASSLEWLNKYLKKNIHKIQQLPSAVTLKKY